MKKCALFSHLTLSFVMLFTLISCSEEENSAQSAVRPVKLSEVLPLGMVESSYTGIVIPVQFSNLAFKLSAPLVALEVERGESVKRGDVIARVDPTEFAIDLEAKKASYITAGFQMERAENLIRREALSKEDYESTKAMYENAKAAYENAGRILEQTILRAPFDGFIQERYVENYQEVSPGEKIVCLIDPLMLQMQATLPEAALGYLSSNPETYVEFDSYKGKRFRARIKEFVQSSPDGSGIPVFVEITDPSFNLQEYKIATGFSCSITFIYPNKEIGLIYNAEPGNPQGNSYIGNDSLHPVTIPVTSLVREYGDERDAVFVFNRANSTVSKRSVETLGIIEGDRVVVIGGLVAGEEVVSAGAARVVDNQRVSPLEGPVAF